MAKKTSKKPPRNGNKQKQKQKQTVIVNINNGKTRAKRQNKKPSVIRTPQYIIHFLYSNKLNHLHLLFIM